MTVAESVLLAGTHRYPGSAPQQAPSSEGISAGSQGQQIYGTVQSQLQGQMSGVPVQPSSLHYQGQQQLQQQQMQQFQQQLYSQPQPFLSQNGNTDYTDDQRLLLDLIVKPNILPGTMQ